MAKLISLKKAAKISGYSPDYLGSLIREGKIGGKRIGRDWFTTEEALRVYLSTKKFLPVKEFLFFRTHPKLSFLFLGVVISGITIATISIFNPPTYFQRSPGDFEDRVELQRKEIIIEEGKGQEVQELEVTSYSSDEAGGIEISLESNP